MLSVLEKPFSAARGPLLTQRRPADRKDDNRRVGRAIDGENDNFVNVNPEEDEEEAIFAQVI